MFTREIIGIYLAAGKSERFGENKLRYPINGRPLGSIALTTALKSTLDKIVVVTSKNETYDWIVPEFFQCFNKKLYVTDCPKASLGQSYSIKHGIYFAQRFNPQAIVILLADQPLIKLTMIELLINTYQSCGKHISFVAANFNGITCPPILFAEKMYEELFQLSGDKGARTLIKNYSGEGVTINFLDTLPCLDIDTKKDIPLLLTNLPEI